MKSKGPKPMCGKGATCANQSCPFPHPKECAVASPTKKEWKPSGGASFDPDHKAIPLIPYVAPPLDVPPHVVQPLQLTCINCGKLFTFTAAAIMHFAEVNWTPPKRCYKCRTQNGSVRDKHATVKIFPPGKRFTENKEDGFGN